MPTKLAKAFATQEGFFLKGSLPQRNHNPGDLEHAPGESHDGTGIVGKFTDDADGWAALERQLQIDAQRGWTLDQLVHVYAPPPENNPGAYINSICQQLGCLISISVADALALGDADV